MDLKAGRSDFIYVASTCPERLDEERLRAHTHHGESKPSLARPAGSAPCAPLARPKALASEGSAAASSVRGWGGPGPRRATS